MPNDNKPGSVQEQQLCAIIATRLAAAEHVLNEALGPDAILATALTYAGAEGVRRVMADLPYRMLPLLSAALGIPLSNVDPASAHG